MTTFQWVILLILLMTCGLVVGITWIDIRKKKPRLATWNMKFITTDGVQTVTVPEDIYQQIKVWLRGEGDSLYEIQSDTAYLGLRRAYIVSVTAELK